MGWKENFIEWCLRPNERKPKKTPKQIIVDEIKNRQSAFEPTEKQAQQVKDWNNRTPIKEVFKDARHSTVEEVKIVKNFVRSKSKIISSNSIDSAITTEDEQEEMTPARSIRAGIEKDSDVIEA